MEGMHARREKIFFACSVEEIQAVLSSHVPQELLYKSLGGTKPEAFDFHVLDMHMRGLDVERRAELSAAALLNTKVDPVDGLDAIDAAPPLASAHQPLAI
jgi:hypothetical protein